MLGMLSTLQTVSTFQPRGSLSAGEAGLAALAAAAGEAPIHYWDFPNDYARFASVPVGGVADTPNWSFSRASAGYAQNSAGVLIPFTSGQLRRTNKGVLIEGARTNLALQSQTFNNASWVKSGSSSISADTQTAPDGTTTADTYTAANDGENIYQQFNVSASTAYVFTFYAKRGSMTGNTYSVQALTGTSGNFVNTAYYNSINNSTFTRITVSFTTASDCTSIRVYPQRGNDGTGTVHFWGAQLEQASFPSSYITTTSSTVTRAADVLTVSSPGVDYPLSLWAEVERVVSVGADGYLIQIDDGDATDRALLIINAADNGRLYQVAANSVVASVNGGAVTANTAIKLAGRASLNSAQIAVSGTAGTEDTSCAAPATPTHIRIGSSSAGGNQPYAYLRRLAIFSSALSDAELQAATS